MLLENVNPPFCLSLLMQQIPVSCFSIIYLFVMSQYWCIICIVFSKVRVKCVQYPQELHTSVCCSRRRREVASVSVLAQAAYTPEVPGCLAIQLLYTKPTERTRIGNVMLYRALRHVVNQWRGSRFSNRSLIHFCQEQGASFGYLERRSFS